MNNAYYCTPNQAKKYVELCIQSGLVANLIGSPGIGKSSIIKQIAEEYSMKVIDLRLSMCDPTDIQGLPFLVGDKAEWTPFKDFPTEETPIPKGYTGFILFLDEFNAAPKSVQAAAYKLVLDRMVGMKKLHPNCAIVTAGNLSSDKAIVNNLSTPMKSRLVHIQMEVNFDNWLTDVAIKNQYDERIIAFLNMFPNKLMDFDPDRDDLTFACPRSWEFVNRLLQNIEGKLTNTHLALFAGTLGAGVGTEFVHFTRVYEYLPKFEDILANPNAVDIPDEISTQWAIVTSLSYKADNKNIDKILTYVKKFDKSFQILFTKMVLINKPQLISSPAVRGYISSMATSMNIDLVEPEEDE